MKNIPNSKFEIRSSNSVKLQQSKLDNGFSRLEYEFQKLYYELEVSKIELELQKEELLRTYEQAQIAAAEYSEWFDFAPIAYFSLSRKGTIMQINKAGAAMLGKNHSVLNNKLFGAFVTNNTKMVFNQFLSRIFTDFTRQNCEIVLISGEGLEINLCLSGIISKDLSHCLITAIDKTERICQQKLLHQM